MQELETTIFSLKERRENCEGFQGLAENRMQELEDSVNEMKQYIPLGYLPESEDDSILTDLVNCSWKLQGLLSDLEASKFFTILPTLLWKVRSSNGGGLSSVIHLTFISNWRTNRMKSSLGNCVSFKKGPPRGLNTISPLSSLTVMVKA